MTDSLSCIGCRVTNESKSFIPSLTVIFMMNKLAVTLIILLDLHLLPSPSQARMERDMSARRIYGEEETPDGAAGSEFGKKQREEARRKKYGIVTREFKVEDQPWILKVNGKAGKR